LRYFGHHTTCRTMELATAAERRKRASDMTTSGYSRGVTFTGKVGPVARGPVPLTAEAAAPLGAI